MVVTGYEGRNSTLVELDVRTLKLKDSVKKHDFDALLINTTPASLPVGQNRLT